MRVYHDEYRSRVDRTLDWNGWFIDWCEDNGQFRSKCEISDQCGFKEYFDFLRYLHEKYFYHSKIANISICFDSKEIAIEAMEYIDSLILINKLAQI